MTLPSHSEHHMHAGLLPSGQDKALPNLLSIGIAEVVRLGITLPSMSKQEEFNGAYFAKQLSKAMDEDGVIPAQLARDFGVQPPSVHEWLKFGRVAKGRLTRIAEYFGRDLAWFLDQDYKGPPGGKKGVMAYHAEEPAPPGTVQIKESSVRFSAGGGRVHFEEIVESEPATYRLSWLRSEGINPRRSKRFKVVGHSMEPTLFPGDTVLVDTSQTEIIDGKVYAIRYGEELRIKKVSRRLDGTIVLTSFNPEYGPETIAPEVAAERLQIIGRVCDKSGKGGL